MELRWLMDGAPKNWAPLSLCEEPEDLRLSEMREARKAVKGRKSFFEGSFSN